jgi:hypothetical protein
MKNPRIYKIKLDLSGNAILTIKLDRKILDQLTFDPAGKQLFEVRLIRQIRASAFLEKLLADAVRKAADQIANEWISK